jgi:hypothetical protein
VDWVDGACVLVQFAMVAGVGEQGNNGDWGYQKWAAGRWAIAGVRALRGSEGRERGMGH